MHELFFSPRCVPVIPDPRETGMKMTDAELVVYGRTIRTVVFEIGTYTTTIRWTIHLHVFTYFYLFLNDFKP